MLFRSGAAYNPDRKNALDIVRICETLDAAVTDFQGGFDNRVQTVITGAAQRPGTIGSTELRQLLGKRDDPFLLLLGTGWGLTEECFATADHILEPIAGLGSYNHLSVRSAAAIMLDRLRGTQ